LYEQIDQCVYFGGSAVSEAPPKANASRLEQQARSSVVLDTFQKHQLALKRFISRFLHNTQDIEDVAQEAFLRAYSADKNTDIKQPKSFLFRIAKNVAVSQLRLKSRQITDYLEDKDSSEVLVGEWTLDDEMAAQQKLGIHCEAVASLTPQCRRVYLMRKVYGMRHKEIAERLDIAVSTVEKHLMKGVELCDLYVRKRMEAGSSGVPKTAAGLKNTTPKGGLR
jgi:RNA polymerase sigma factor (sigma-70 family)